MYVPEAAVNKNNLVMSSENQVGFAGEIILMKPIPVSHAVNNGADQYFGPCVFGPNPGHVVRTLFFGVNINHQKLSSASVLRTSK